MGAGHSLKVASCVTGQRASAFLQGICPLANNNNNNNNNYNNNNNNNTSSGSHHRKE